MHLANRLVQHRARISHLLVRHVRVYVGNNHVGFVGAKIGLKKQLIAIAINGALIKQAGISAVVFAVRTPAKLAGDLHETFDELGLVCVKGSWSQLAFGNFFQRARGVRESTKKFGAPFLNISQLDVAVPLPSLISTSTWPVVPSCPRSSLARSAIFRIPAQNRGKGSTKPSG